MQKLSEDISEIVGEAVERGVETSEVLDMLLSYYVLIHKDRFKDKDNWQQACLVNLAEAMTKIDGWKL